MLGDGEARQNLRKAENAFVLAQQELGAAQSQMEGTRRLFEKEFVTRVEVEKDELSLQRAQINLASAETARDLFIKYEFPKTAEKLFSDYVEGLRRLEVARRAAASKIAQATARLRSAEAQFELQSRKKRELHEQIEKCVMRATQPGLVVYGEGNGDYWRNDNRIEEGAMVRERQVIITIPDTSVMTVEVKVHESQVKSVAVGQRARIVVDAYPDRPLSGEVVKIGVLPDSQNRWMNPDLKVYNTTVRIDGTHDWLKPGMTAEAAIQVKRLDDVVQVPLQAVNPTEDGHVVYVRTATGVTPQKVQIGEFNNTFIEIKSGLTPGQTVLLISPEGSGTSKAKPAGEGEGEEEAKQENSGGGEAAPGGAA
jgi:HlyD family secretion protein